MNLSQIAEIRYSGDSQMLASLNSNPKLSKRIADFRPQQHRNSIRTHLLQSAVRVDERLLPKLARCVKRLHETVGVQDSIETYVYEGSAINAFVTRGRAHLYVALSSGAVNVLTDEELEFVVGHEFGHAVFEHVDVGVGHLLEASDLDPRDRMQMFAWKRAAEISADRMGLVCCGSLAIAATAMFKTLSGLNLPGLMIDAQAFSEQWDHLVAEVINCGANDEHWQLTHPFPPLRMKAMQLFAASRGGTTAGSSDVDVEKLLSMMDPRARENRDGVDPLLADFVLWGGIAVALASGDIGEHERRKLLGISTPENLERALTRNPSLDQALQNFQAALGRRHLQLKSLEIFRIAEALLHIAHADGEMEPAEKDCLARLLGIMGVGPDACELLMARYQKDR